MITNTEVVLSKINIALCLRKLPVDKSNGIVTFRLEVFNLQYDSFSSSHHFLSEEDLNYYRPRIRDIYFDAVDLYVVRNPNVAAFMGLSEDMVEMLFVLPSEQGKGYGSALLNYAFEEKHIRKIDVNEQNTEAYQFYVNRGYHAVSRDEVDADGKPYPIIHLER